MPCKVKMPLKYSRTALIKDQLWQIKRLFFQEPLPSQAIMWRVFFHIMCFSFPVLPSSVPRVPRSTTSQHTWASWSGTLRATDATSSSPAAHSPGMTCDKSREKFKWSERRSFSILETLIRSAKNAKVFIQKTAKILSRIFAPSPWPWYIKKYGGSD